MPNRPSVLVVEDEPHTRLHLSNAIRACGELQLLADVGTAREARAVLARSAPDVLLTDLQLPDGHGLDLIRETRAAHEDTAIMVITVFGDEATVVSALEAGAGGYLLKDRPSEEIGASVLDLLAGGAPLSPAVARFLLKRLRGDRGAPGAGAGLLTARQTEILQLVAKGFTFPEIADLLDLSVHTVKTHVRNTYEKLQVSSRSEAVFEAVNLGILDR